MKKNLIIATGVIIIAAIAAYLGYLGGKSDSNQSAGDFGQEASSGTTTYHETDTTAFISGPSDGAPEQDVLPSEETVATTSDSSDGSSLVAAAVTALSGSNALSVDYSKSLDDALASMNLGNHKINPNIMAGIFPFSQSSGSLSLSVQSVSPATIIANYSTTTAASMTCDQYLASIKTAGYRPLTLQEGIAYATQFPGKSGTFLGSIVNVSGVKADYNSVWNLGSSGDFLYYGNDTKAYVSNAPAKGMYAYPSTDGRSLSVSMGKNTCVTSFIGVKSDSYSIPSISTLAQLPVSLKMSQLNGPAKAVVFPTKYSVNVNYDENTANQENTPKITGTHAASVQLVHIYGGGHKETNKAANLGSILWMSQDTAKALIATQLPGYRPALENEMIALEKQYPTASMKAAGGASQMMAFGTWNPKCKNYPWMYGMGWIGTGAKLFEKVLGDQGLSSGQISGPSNSTANYTPSLRVYPVDYWVFPVVKI